MDAIRLLGGLLGGRGATGGLGRKILEGVLAGDQRTRQPVATQGRVRSSTKRAHNGGLLGNILRDVYARQQRPAGHHQHGGGHHHHYEPEHCRHGYDDNDLNQRAVVLIRAMINAAKADGQVDPREQDKILSQLGRISPEEDQFLRQEFRRPLDVHAFAHSVPTGMEHEVYAMSLMAIDLDNRAEAAYLHELAGCLRIDHHTCNEIHEHYHAPAIFR